MMMHFCHPISFRVFHTTNKNPKFVKSVSYKIKQTILNVHQKHATVKKKTYKINIKT